MNILLFFDHFKLLEEVGDFAFVSHHSKSIE